MTLLLASALSRIRATLRALGRETATFIDASANALPRRLSAHDARSRLVDFETLFAEFENHCSELIATHRPRGSDLRLASRMLKTSHELKHVTRICFDMANQKGASHFACDPIDREVAPSLASATRRTASLLRNGIVEAIAEHDGHIELARLQFDSLMDLLKGLVRQGELVARRDPSAAEACMQIVQYCEQLQRIAEIALRVYEFGTRFERLPVIPMRPDHQALCERQQNLAE